MWANIGRHLEAVKHPDGYDRARRGLIARLDEPPQLPPHLTIIPPHGLASRDPIFGVLAPVEISAPAIRLPHHDFECQRSLLPGPLGFPGRCQRELPDELLAFTILFGQDKLPVDELAVI
jgi:hypothetical protein